MKLYICITKMISAAVTHSNDEPEDSSPTESEKKRDFEHENVRSEHSDATRTGGSVSSVRVVF